MDSNKIKLLLENVQEGKTSIDEALSSLKRLPFEDLGFAKLDHHRAMRHGFPEVVWGEGKQTDHLVKIVDRLQQENNTVLATRICPEVGKILKEQFTQGSYLEVPRLFVIEKSAPPKKNRGTILVMSAGTADIPVAEEAYWTAHYMGNEVQKIYDVGVSGLHRFLSHTEKIQKASVIIVVAGMEGALASVVGGIAGVPVIGVPTSIGYGTNFSGVTPLFSMLSSCASGITVVNIDNGFGAAYAASLINRVAG